jgi:hypothetical protein
MRGGLEIRAVKVPPQVAEINTPQPMDVAQERCVYAELINCVALVDNFSTLIQAKGS